MARTPEPSQLGSHGTAPVEETKPDFAKRFATAGYNPNVPANSFGAQVRALAQGSRTGGIGKQVSALAHERNAARKANDRTRKGMS